MARRKRARGSSTSAKRKKRKPAKATPRARRKVNVFARAPIAAPPRKTMGEGWAARVVAPPSHYPRPEDALGPVPLVGPADVEDVRAQSVLDELLRGAIDPSDAAEVAAMDPDGSYVMVLIVRGGSGREQQREKGLAVDERRIVYVGRGRRLQYLAMYHASEDGEVVAVEIKRAARDWQVGKAFPVWSDGVVELEGGGVIKGSGSRALYEASRPDRERPKGGRRKKAGGGLTAAENKRRKARKREADRRYERSEERIKALVAAGDDAGARKLRARVEAMRANAVRQRAKKAATARAKVKPKGKKRKGKKK